MGSQSEQADVTNTLGAREIDAEAEFERIFVAGARSFSIRTATGELIYDSGDAFEKIIEARELAIFNSLLWIRGATIMARNRRP